MLRRTGLSKYDPAFPSGPGLLTAREDPKHFRRWLTTVVGNFANAQFKKHKLLCPSWKGPMLPGFTADDSHSLSSPALSEALFDREYADATLREGVRKLRRDTLKLPAPEYERLVRCFLTQGTLGMEGSALLSKQQRFAFKKLADFEVLKRFFFDPDASQVEASQKLGVSGDNCRVLICRIRRRWRDRVRRLVRETTETDRDADREVQHLIDAHVLDRPLDELLRAREWILELTETEALVETAPEVRHE